MNLLEQLRTLLHASPFRPFRVHLTNGRTFTVRQPDFLTVTGRGNVIYEPTHEVGAWVSPLHIVTLDTVPDSAAAES